MVDTTRATSRTTRESASSGLGAFAQDGSRIDHPANATGGARDV